MPSGRKAKSASPARPAQAARGEVEQATDRLFRAWGSWWRAPPERRDEAKLEVERAEEKYREAQRHLEEAHSESDLSAR